MLFLSAASAHSHTISLSLSLAHTPISPSLSLRRIREAGDLSDELLRATQALEDKQTDWAVQADKLKQRCKRAEEDVTAARAEIAEQASQVV